MASIKATAGSRALHWVLKIGNLKESLRFLEGVIGLRVLRHEEFTSGCEATCNGPYGGAWSKTMVGYGPEKDNFVLELTYNYGIDSYAFGNDLQYIAIAEPVALVRAKALGYKIENEDTIVGPDNYKYKIIPLVKGQAERFTAVALRSSNLSNTKSYWLDVLGLNEFPIPAALQSKNPSVLVGFDNIQTKLHFIEVQDGQPVDHALSGGRIAFACINVPRIYESILASGDRVQTTPLTLPTPGKADVVVTILTDRDGYEICFVEEVGFYDLATPIYDVIDFAERASRGGDGAPPPKGESIVLDGVTDVSDISEVEALVSQVPVLCLDFKAGWCKNCKKIAPSVQELAGTYKGRVQVVQVDIDSAADLALEYEVSQLPRFIFLKGGIGKEHIVEDYLGSDVAEITNRFAKASN